MKNNSIKRKGTGTWYYNNYPKTDEKVYQKRKRKICSIDVGRRYAYLERRINGNIYVKWYRISYNEAKKIANKLKHNLPKYYQISITPTSSMWGVDRNKCDVYVRSKAI